MASRVNDTFTEGSDTDLASHTGETGATWTKHSSSTGGNADVIAADDNLRGYDGVADTDNLMYYASGDPDTNEYNVQCDFKVESTSGIDNYHGITARMSTSVVTYYMVRYNTSNSKWQLYKRVTGTWTLLGENTNVLTLGQTYTCRLECLDATKKVWVEDVERLSSTDNSITAAGKAGLRLHIGGNGSDRLRLDNFQLNDLTEESGDDPSLGGLDYVGGALGAGW